MRHLATAGGSDKLFMAAGAMSAGRATLAQEVERLQPVVPGLGDNRIDAGGWWTSLRFG